MILIDLKPCFSSTYYSIVFKMTHEVFKVLPTKPSKSAPAHRSTSEPSTSSSSELPKAYDYKTKANEKGILRRSIVILRIRKI